MTPYLMQQPPHEPTWCAWAARAYCFERAQAVSRERQLVLRRHALNRSERAAALAAVQKPQPEYL